MLRRQIQKDLLGDVKGDIREREYYQDFWPENLAYNDAIDRDRET